MKILFYLLTILVIITGVIQQTTIDSFAQTKVQTILATDTTKPILPSDSVKRIGNTFTTMQDTLYQRALRMRISANSRFWNDMRIYGRFSKIPTNEEMTYAEILNRNMQIPAEFYLPNPQEVALNQYAINQSTFVPGLLQHRNPGMQIDISDILSIFGLTEDVSSVVRYQLLEPCYVEIVVYSMQAKVIRTILQSEQAVGTYEVTWNGRNDAGVRMPPGDYVSEVRLLQCNGRIFRKRIVLP